MEAARPSEVTPSTPDGVVDAIVEVINGAPGRLRVAIDGAPVAEPEQLAARVIAALAPRPALLVRADHFWRQASLRLEHGRQNPDAWLDGWLDERALRSEVLDPLPISGRVLPALRHPVTDRSLRAAFVDLPSDGVVIVAGSVLLGRGLPFDRVVHVHLSPAALARRTPPEQAWILPALARYESECGPSACADLLVRGDDPRHPALVRNRR